jgi:catabolite regulation protein CreA
LTYSDKLIEGSPKNSISAVAIHDWQWDQSATVPPAQ